MRTFQKSFVLFKNFLFITALQKFLSHPWNFKFILEQWLNPGRNWGNLFSRNGKIFFRNFISSQNFERMSKKKKNQKLWGDLQNFIKTRWNFDTELYWPTKQKIHNPVFQIVVKSIFKFFGKKKKKGCTSKWVRTSLTVGLNGVSGNIKVKDQSNIFKSVVQMGRGLKWSCGFFLSWFGNLTEQKWRNSLLS